MNAPLKLLWKLMVINVMALTVAMLILWVSIHVLALDHFTRLSVRYNLDPADASAMFLESVTHYSLLASLTGLIVGSLLSLLLSYRLTKPLHTIQLAAASIAAGTYVQPVTVRGCGEIDELSRAFNDMAVRLQRADRLRKEFIVDMAHELRTPLTNIRGYTEGLRDGVIPGEPEIFASLHEESLRLIQLVEDLLQLARADVARTDLSLELCDLKGLIEQTLQTFRPRFDERGLAMQFALTEPLPVEVDPPRIQQVLVNLLENALRYTSPGGQICGKVAYLNGFVRVTLANDVAGSLHLTDEVFERFHRGESSRSRESGGAGLGLAIVRRLVEAHGGRVGIQQHDHQADVWFDLPDRRAADL